MYVFTSHDASLTLLWSQQQSPTVSLLNKAFQCDSRQYDPTEQRPHKDAFILRCCWKQPVAAARTPACSRGVLLGGVSLHTQAHGGQGSPAATQHHHQAELSEDLSRTHGAQLCHICAEQLFVSGNESTAFPPSTPWQTQQQSFLPSHGCYFQLLCVFVYYRVTASGAGRLSDSEHVPSRRS